MQKRLKILVSNDDGIDSKGIFYLVKAMKELGDVIVVAPDRQQSAVGHSLTISSPLRATPFKRDGEMFGYAVNGTPTDCVKLAIFGLLDYKPDLVVSGINHGQNTAINILYSGTVSAATEGMLAGIKSMAVSLADHDVDADMEAASIVSLEIAKKLVNIEMPKDTFLNVNVPNVTYDKIKGIKVVKHSNAYWEDKFELRKDPFKNDYYWFSGDYKVDKEEIDTDDYSLINNYVSITPIHYNFTKNDYLLDLEREFK